MASFTHKKSSGGNGARSTGGIVGAIVPPKKKVDNFPLMSYVAKNCSYSDNGEDSLDDEDVLKAYNDQRVKELLNDAAKSVQDRKRDAGSSDESEDRKKALEVLRSMEWSKNQEETWKVVKSKKETDYGGFLHPLKSKRTEDEYFSGINNRVKKPKERKRSRSVSEVVVLDNGTFVPKSYPSQELPIKFNLPPRPTTPRVTSVGLPFTPGPPPTTTNNQWLQRSGSTLFSDVRSNTIMAYGVSCDEDQAMALAIAESLRTVKCEQERILKLGTPSGPLVSSSRSSVETNVPSKHFDAHSNDKENSQEPSTLPKPHREQAAKVLQTNNAAELLPQDKAADDNNNNKKWANWKDTNTKTEQENLNQRTKYASCAQVPSRPLIFFDSIAANSQEPRVKSPGAEDQQAKYSDSWQSAEPKNPGCVPKHNSESNPFKKILNSYSKFDGKIDSTATLSPDPPKKSTLRMPMTSTMKSIYSQEADKEKAPEAEGEVPEALPHASFSTTLAKATRSVGKLDLKTSPFSDQADHEADTKSIAEVKEPRSEQDCVPSSTPVTAGNTVAQTGSDTKSVVSDPQVRRHRSFVIHSEIPAKTSNFNNVPQVEKRNPPAEESNPSSLTTVKQTTPKENVKPPPAQQDEQAHQQPTLTHPVFPSINPSAAQDIANLVAAQQQLNQQPTATPPVFPSMNPSAAQDVANLVAAQQQLNQQSTVTPPVFPSMNPSATQDVASLVAAQQQMQLQLQMMQAMGIMPPVLPSAQNMPGMNTHLGQPQQENLQNQVQAPFPGTINPSLAGHHGLPNPLANSMPGYPLSQLGGIPGLPNMMLPNLVNPMNPMQSNMLGVPSGYPAGFPLMQNIMPGVQSVPTMPGLLNNFQNSMPGFQNVLQSHVAGLSSMVPPSVPPSCPGSMNTFPNGVPAGYSNIMPPSGMPNNFSKPSIPGMRSCNSFSGLTSFSEPGNVPLVSSKGRGRLARNNPSD